MTIPSLTPGIEEPSELSSPWVEPSDVWSFVGVAVKTAESQVVQNAAAAMLARNNVIDFEWSWVIGLWEMAILAHVTSTAPNMIDKRLIHEQLDSLPCFFQCLHCL